ncbi:oligosaccharide flippase family protein [Pseudomonas schmalbachii]|uniref:Oligosaccharide flippase family protein n=1 Tax=Pseudomonas schmalbachii TaxID=2816993 RepID=A0ABS3TU12_9PSED|nr:oligosaccharide flippase family protein [Pseudomonas schmalbachii]MBO3277149.1 oligosaccharide flippase family protein [Pseudomonas schmalbachii]
MLGKISYSLLNNIAVAIFPVITIPIVLHKIPLDTYGEYISIYLAYTIANSIVILSFSSSANRSYLESTLRKEEEKCFIKLITCQFLLTIPLFLIYTTATTIIPTNNKAITCLFLIATISSSLNVDWYFYAKQLYKMLFWRNLSLRAIAIILLLLSIKNEGDITIYALITSTLIVSTNLLGFLMAWKENVTKPLKITKLLDAWQEIKSAKHFYTNSGIATSYQQLDQILIGSLLGEAHLAKLNILKQLILVPTNITGTYSKFFTTQAVLSRSTGTYKKTIKRTLKGFVLLLLALAIIGLPLGLPVINFLTASQADYSFKDIALCAGVALSTSAAVFINTQISIPLKLEKINTASNIFVSATSLLTMYSLHEEYGYLSAIIGLLAGETLGVLIMITLHILYKRKRNNTNITISN